MLMIREEGKTVQISGAPGWGRVEWIGKVAAGASYLLAVPKLTKAMKLPQRNARIAAIKAIIEQHGGKFVVAA